ncbi:unnamed protein product [Amoebophrya sp. A120]|nr:unnamed protein product [Amoebophrya sp. A120]|eukprot:GSA120T00013025001.1
MPAFLASSRGRRCCEPACWTRARSDWSGRRSAKIPPWTWWRRPCSRAAAPTRPKSTRPTTSTTRRRTSSGMRTCFRATPAGTWCARSIPTRSGKTGTTECCAPGCCTSRGSSSSCWATPACTGSAAIFSSRTAAAQNPTRRPTWWSCGASGRNGWRGRRPTRKRIRDYLVKTAAAKAEALPQPATWPRLQKRAKARTTRRQKDLHLQNSHPVQELRTLSKHGNSTRKHCRPHLILHLLALSRLQARKYRRPALCRRRKSKILQRERDQAFVLPALRDQIFALPALLVPISALPARQIPVLPALATASDAFCGRSKTELFLLPVPGRAFCRPEAETNCGSGDHAGPQRGKMKKKTAMMKMMMKREMREKIQ